MPSPNTYKKRRNEKKRKRGGYLSMEGRATRKAARHKKYLAKLSASAPTARARRLEKRARKRFQK